MKKITLANALAHIAATNKDDMLTQEIADRDGAMGMVLFVNKRGDIGFALFDIQHPMGMAFSDIAERYIRPATLTALQALGSQQQ